MLLAITATVVAFATLSSLVQGCPGHVAAREAASKPFQLGNDPPASSEVLGYNINRFALMTNNLESMLHFYGEVLGLRKIFSYEASPEFSIAYLAYSQGGKNGTGYQTGAELYSEKLNSQGIIELLAFKPSNGTEEARFSPSTKVPNTFSHVGLIVPDIMAAQERMLRHGVNILKRVGDDIEQGTPAALGFGFDKLHSTRAAAKAAITGIDAFGFKKFLLITDPDGNLIEVQPQY